MAVLARQAVGDGGAVALAPANAGGDSFNNTGNERLVVQNLAGATRRVHVVGGARACNFGVAGAPAHDVEYIIPAGVRWEFKPFRTDRFNDGNENVQLTYPDGVAGPLNVGVYV
jgi:hypothetical protein